MTLEELKASQPEIHAKLLAEAAARDPRPRNGLVSVVTRHPSPRAGRDPHGRARAPGRRAVAAAAAAPAPAAAPDGAPVGLGADVVAALEAVRRHGDDLIGGLAARGAAYRRGEAPTPTTPELSAGARRVAEQFRDELENAARRTTTPEPPGPGPRARFGGARRRPGARAAVDGGDVARVAAVAAAQPRYVPRPTPSMPGIYELSTEALAAAPNAGAVDALYAAWPERVLRPRGASWTPRRATPGWTSSSRGTRRAPSARGATSRPWNPRARPGSRTDREAAAAPDDALAPDAADGTDALAPDDADDGCAASSCPTTRRRRPAASAARPSTSPGTRPPANGSSPPPSRCRSTTAPTPSCTARAATPSAAAAARSRPRRSSRSRRRRPDRRLPKVAR